MNFTCVEIKNDKYVKLIPLDRVCEKKLDLTTIQKNQKTAFVKIYIVDKNRKKELLKNIQINNIKLGNSGIPELNLTVAFDGTRAYKIVLKQNGFICHSSVVDIKHILNPKPKIANILLISSAFIVVSVLGFFLIKSLIINEDSNRVNLNYNNVADTGSTDTGITVEEVIPEAVLIDQKAVVYFQPNGISLSVKAKSVLDQVLEILEKEDNLDVDIIGHCAFFGTEKGRQEISSERADNVYNYFISKGWTPLNKPELEGLGHSQLLTKDPDKQNLNRRVEISIKSILED